VVKANGLSTKIFHNDAVVGHVLATTIEKSEQFRSISKEARVQILPLRVVFFDEIDLPLTRPMLHRFLALNGKMDIAEAFVPNQTVNAIFLGKAFAHTFLMLPRSADNVGGDADIECAIGF
jgi:hypothetical protein